MFEHVLHIFFKQLHLYCYLVEDTKHKRIINDLLAVPLNFCKGLIHQVYDIRHVRKSELPLREVLNVPCLPI